VPWQNMRLQTVRAGFNARFGEQEIYDGDEESGERLRRLHAATMAELGVPAERAVVAAAGGGGGQWRNRADFPSNAEYGAYIQAELTRGVRLAAPRPPPPSPSPFPSECCCPRLAASTVVDCMLSLLGEVVPSCRGGTHTESRRCRRQVYGCGRCAKRRARSTQATRGAFSRPTAAHRRARCSGISTGTATGCSGTTSRSSSPPRQLVLVLALALALALHQRPRLR
jgi:hypothetical protein